MAPGGNPRYGQDAAGALPPGMETGQIRGHANCYHPWAFSNSYMHNITNEQFTRPTYGTILASPFTGAQQSLPIPTVDGLHVSRTAQAPALPQFQGNYPAIDRNFRTCNLQNSTGGYGCEPGYNYFFPEEHTKIHVLKTGSTPPWQLPANFAIQFHACHVPVNTTVAELMKGFGSRNAVLKKNVVTEVCPGGAGKWYKGIELRGDDFEMMKLPIKELGWDKTRTGLRGEKKVVYIYVQKD